MKSIRLVMAIILIIILLLLAIAVHPIASYQRGVVLRFGKVALKDSAPELLMPGIHWLLPMVYTVKHIDLRAHTMTLHDVSVNTADAQGVDLSLGVIWQVTSPTQYASQSNEDLSQQLISAVTEPLQKISTQLNISQLVSAQVSDTLLAAANQAAAARGVKILAISVNNIRLPSASYDALVKQMQSSLTAEAKSMQAAGKAQAEALRANAKEDGNLKLETAQLSAAKEKALGDAKAAGIYNSAYQANPQFYAFYRSMQAYQQAFNHPGTVLVIKPTGQFFQYFNSLQGLGIKP